jgi:hypothetical protein
MCNNKSPLEKNRIRGDNGANNAQYSPEMKHGWKLVFYPGSLVGDLESGGRYNSLINKFVPEASEMHSHDQTVISPPAVELGSRSLTNRITLSNLILPKEYYYVPVMGRNSNSGWAVLCPVTRLPFIAAKLRFRTRTLRMQRPSLCWVTACDPPVDREGIRNYIMESRETRVRQTST